MAALFKKKTEGADKEAKVTKEKKGKKKAAIEGQAGRELSALLLREPLITEKAHALSQEGTYVFVVDKSAARDRVKLAVEQLYSVTVLGVRMHNSKPKKRRFGKSVGYTVGKKKAFVTLKKGDSIDIFLSA